jgi:hypothetical protein
VSASDYLAAEPDVLRNTAAELVKLWNEWVIRVHTLFSPFALWVSVNL